MAKKKKTQQSFAEQEMEAYAKAEPDIHEDPVKIILGIIKKHSDEVCLASVRYLDRGDFEQHKTYSDIAAAFDILKEDLRKEGFDI